MQQKYSFPVIGEITLNTNDASLALFAKRQLKNYFLSEKKTITNTTSIECISDTEIKKMKSFIASHDMLGRNIVVSENQIIVEQYFFKLDGNKLIIEQCKSTSFVHTLLKNIYYLTIGNTKRKKYASLHSKYYEKVLFPILSLYALKEGYYCLHASLVEINNKHIIISGLDGVGKSSISNKLDFMNKGHLLADNIVLFNGIFAIPLNCVMRLAKYEDTKYEILYQAKDFAEVLPAHLVYEKCCIDKIFNLSVAKEKFSLNKINCEMSYLTLFLNNAPEIARANKLLSVLAYINLESGYKFSKQNLSNFYSLSIPRGKIEEAVEVLINEC